MFSPSAFFALPPIRRYDHGSKTLIASEVFPGLTDDEKAHIIADDRWSKWHRNFAAFARPGEAGWGVPDADLVLETVHVGVLRMYNLVFMVNGQRFVEMWDGVGLGPENYTYQTWDEFEFLTGKSVRLYLNTFVTMQINSMKRAVMLAAVDTSHTAKVSYTDPVNFTVGEVTVTYWVDDQIDRYLERSNTSCLAKELV